MKNKIILVLAFVLLSTATVFAAAGKEPAFTKDDGTVPFTFKVSNNITVAYSTEAATLAQKYAVVTKNKAGNRFFGSSNDTSNIYYIEATANIGKDATDTIATTASAAGVLVSTNWISQ